MGNSIPGARGGSVSPSIDAPSSTDLSGDFSTEDGELPTLWKGPRVYIKV